MTVRYAWPTFLEPLNLAIEATQLDGRSSVAETDHEHRRVRLVADNWLVIVLEVVVSTDEHTDIDDLDCFALVSSARTQSRIPVRLQRASGAAVRFGGSVELHRRELAGAVSLSAELTAEFGGMRRQVGRSVEWTLIVDESEAPFRPGSPPFTTTWVDFTADGAPDIVRRSPETYAVMDVSSTPTLYLNLAIEGLNGLLNADTARQERRRLRDVLGSRIARDAAAAIFRAAAADATSSDEPRPPTDPLQRRLCEAVAAAMPTVVTVDELYERLKSAEDEGGAQRALLWTDIDVALDVMTGVAATVSKVVGEVKYV